LKPVSLRSEPVPPEYAVKVNGWRQFFTVREDGPPSVVQAVHGLSSTNTSKLVDPQWLASNLGRAGVKVIDVRTQPEYNTSHIPGSLLISVESFRGVVGGVPSLLLPAEMLAAHFSLMGLEPSDFVVIVPGEKLIDATLVAMAFNRLGHQGFGVLVGGFGRWVAEKHPVDNVLPKVTQSSYPVRPGTDNFTVGYQAVLQHMKKQGAVILDVRPSDFYLGNKSDEARAGHIPGALNRPFSEDALKTDEAVRFKPIEELEEVYKTLIPSKDTPVIVHCRTGHQASQTFFVLKHLLGYTDVTWYDAGWTEWAARRELPIEKGPKL
jgi:thiosulfate/3-mercaptopyruvate sulfurtransferase